ncbi:hypothetical protein [Streptomyces sp. NBC_00690]|uniref:hypothetical protein n=1 Tax=Streptomyces sp. NBC_00690 TaxID=2975808 RepID=UPI002E294917|nr:hypothetical protein [Streptomyces sp. NBC_00690]
MAFETTDRDLSRWQRAAVDALAAMLAHGQRDGLPVLHWGISKTGALAGDVHGLTSTPAEQRAAFDAWADYLGAKRWPERTDADGTVRLHAQFSRSRDRQAKSVAGALRAVLLPEYEPDTA